MGVSAKTAPGWNNCAISSLSPPKLRIRLKREVRRQCGIVGRCPDLAGARIEQIVDRVPRGFQRWIERDTHLVGGRNRALNGPCERWRGRSQPQGEHRGEDDKRADQDQYAPELLSAGNPRSFSLKICVPQSFFKVFPSVFKIFPLKAAEIYSRLMQKSVCFMPGLGDGRGVNGRADQTLRHHLPVPGT